MKKEKENSTFPPFLKFYFLSYYYLAATMSWPRGTSNTMAEYVRAPLWLNHAIDCSTSVDINPKGKREKKLKPKRIQKTM